MKMKLLLALALVLCVEGARAEGTNVPVKIGAVDAAKHYDEVLTVTGKVAQVTLRPTIVFINLDEPFPDSPIAAIIHSKDTNQFANLKGLKGESVEITGKIVKFHEKPEIVLEKASQLSIVGTKKSAPAPESSAPASKGGTNDLTKGIM